MNRREFLKGGLGGLFGAFFAWTGVMKGEDVEIETEEPEFHGFARVWDGEEERSYLDGKRQAFEGSLADHFSEEGSSHVWLTLSDKPLCFGDGFAKGCYTCACIEECEASYSRRCSDNANRDDSADTFQHNPDSDLGGLFSQNGQIDWPRTKATLEEIGILPRDSCGRCPWRAECEAGHFAWCSGDYSADTGGVPMTVPASLTACTSSESYDVDNPAWASRDGKWHHYQTTPGGAVTYADGDPVSYADGTPMPATADGADPDRWAPGTTWFVDLVDGSDSNDGLTPETAVLDPAEAIARREGNRADYLLVFPGDGTVDAIFDPCAPRGAVWSEIGHGFGHWIHWFNEGSDENGTGTMEDPVATEACAQSIADLGNVVI